MNSYILVAVVLYTAWAIYSGYKYLPLHRMTVM